MARMTASTDSIAAGPDTSLGLGLHVEKEVDDITILHGVGLPFGAESPFLAGLSDGTRANKILVANNLSTNEPSLDIRMNLGGSIHGYHTLVLI